ncbi:arachidonate 15-lipoxygenase precursor [Microcystis viridis NIES-102]|uniref:Arachidonate 15-lipoxygenase n=1 Tax=Microcystis viridis NIES-102 TaxID=213615 RepID=A0A3G9K2W0_MICVR|nr:lipoxygenase family protein [Microcystis viridis]BBH39190.1 arachidonate 15-lipoxygenase precursor [Microcystis viridis NIES-102]
MLTPSLPKNDPDPVKRQDLLRRQKQVYIYDSVNGITLVKDLPTHENFSISYQVMRGKGFSALIANGVATRVENIFDPFDKLEDYEELFPILPQPTSIKTWQSNTSFAYQRLAGANPMVIRGISSLPNNFPVSDAIFQKAMGPDKTIASEAAKGNLFLADYAPLHHLTLGSYQRGMKTVTAPLVLFCWRARGLRGQGGLVPVAIQLYQDPTLPNQRIYTPDDGLNWLMAKIFVQIADGNHHELVSHLSHTHLVAEAFVLATATELALNHPLAILLRPHFQFTLAINSLAESELINPGGFVDRLLAGTLEASIELIKSSYRQRLDNFADYALPKQLAFRQVDDTSLLPDYPYRDDALLLWQATETYVKDYLSLYYTSDADVNEDTELQAWARKLMSSEGGGIKKLVSDGELDTLAKLVEVVTQIIFVAGPQHAAVNYPQYDYLAFSPNIPLAGYQSPPKAAEEVDIDYILRLLPPQAQAAYQLEIMQTLTAFQFNRFGYPSRSAFPDQRAYPILAVFQAKLKAIENEIDRRNLTRFTPYIFLKPSRIPNSINI